MLTLQQADVLRQRLAKFDAWLDTKRTRNGWASYKPEDIPPDVPTVDNDERSALEVCDFVNDPPASYFVYIKERVPGQAAPLVGTATTWTGERLGWVRFGRPWRDNFGGTRVPARIEAINGRYYVGTYYKSAGDFARIRLAKGGR